jgi:hypothetical protein
MPHKQLFVIIQPNNDAVVFFIQHLIIKIAFK